MEPPSSKTSTVALASLVPAKVRVVSEVISSPEVPVSSEMPTTTGGTGADSSTVSEKAPETAEILPAKSEACAVIA